MWTLHRWPPRLKAYAGRPDNLLAETAHYKAVLDHKDFGLGAPKTTKQVDSATWMSIFLLKFEEADAYTRLDSHEADPVGSRRVSSIITSLASYPATSWPFPERPHLTDHGLTLKRAVPWCVGGERDVRLVLNERIDPAAGDICSNRKHEIDMGDGDLTC